MEAFQAHPNILAGAEARKIIKNYNKLAKVLLEFEMLYHRGWLRQVRPASLGWGWEGYTGNLYNSLEIYKEKLRKSSNSYILIMIPLKALSYARYISCMVIIKYNKFLIIYLIKFVPLSHMPRSCL